MRDASEDRNLRKPKNLGEFAFATCAFGMLLLVPAVFIAVVSGMLLRDYVWLPFSGDWDVLVLTVLFWIPLQAPVYRSLLKHANSWETVDSHSRQLFVVALCTLGVIAVFRVLAWGDSAFSNVATGLKYLFSACVAMLVIYHGAACYFLRLRPKRREVMTWLVVLLSSVFAFRDLEL